MEAPKCEGWVSTAPLEKTLRSLPFDAEFAGLMFDGSWVSIRTKPEVTPEEFKAAVSKLPGFQFAEADRLLEVQLYDLQPSIVEFTIEPAVPSVEAGQDSAQSPVQAPAKSLFSNTTVADEAVRDVLDGDRSL